MVPKETLKASLLLQAKVLKFLKAINALGVDLKHVIPQKVDGHRGGGG